MAKSISLLQLRGVCVAARHRSRNLAEVRDHADASCNRDYGQGPKDCALALPISEINDEIFACRFRRARQPH